MNDSIYALTDNRRYIRVMRNGLKNGFTIYETKVGENGDVHHAKNEIWKKMKVPWYLNIWGFILRSTDTSKALELVQGAAVKGEGRASYLRMVLDHKRTVKSFFRHYFGYGYVLWYSGVNIQDHLTISDSVYIFWGDVLPDVVKCLSFQSIQHTCDTRCCVELIEETPYALDHSDSIPPFISWWRDPVHCWLFEH